MNRIIIISLTLLLSVGCANQTQTSKNTETISSVFKSNLTSSKLATGWYYTSSSPNEFKRTLEKSGEEFFINPEPIAINSDFGGMEIYESDAGGEHYVGLTIRLNGDAVKRWEEATDRYVGKHLALIVNDKLVNAPRVNSPIPNGMTALNRSEYSKKELLKIKSELERN